MTGQRYLKRNEGTGFPRTWLFLATETRNVALDAETTRRELVRGWARIWVRGDQHNPSRIRDYCFQTAEQFWGWAATRLGPKSRVVLVADGLGEQLRLLDAFGWLTKTGWQMERLHESAGSSIWAFRHESTTLLCLDIRNYYPMDGRALVEQLACSEPAHLAETRYDYRPDDPGRRDADGLYHAIQRVVKLMKDEDRGHFAATTAGLAFNAYRHGHPNARIVLHDNPNARAIERASYYGGRVTAYRRGTYLADTYTLLDVNSLYPAMMHTFEFPRRLIKYIEGDWRINVFRNVDPSRCIALVYVETDDPLYPVRKGVSVHYPIGRYWTTVAGPELSGAVRNGHVRRVRAIAYYELATLFRDYVEDLWTLRRLAKLGDDMAGDVLYKQMLNTVHGKFAQKNPIWEFMGLSKWRLNTYWDYRRYATGEWELWRNICGRAERLIGHEDAEQSFPAISAFVAGYARAELQSLCEVAGRGHVYYVDTDSLIVDSVGRRNLDHLVQRDELGALKVVEEGPELEIIGRKWYSLGAKRAHGGVGDGAELVDDTQYVEWVTEQLAEALRQEHGSVVIDKRRVVRVREIGQREEYDENGWWVPEWIEQTGPAARADARDQR